MKIVTETLKDMIEYIKTQTNEEFLDSLRNAGIIDEHNELTEHYRTKSKKKKKNETIKTCRKNV